MLLNSLIRFAWMIAENCDPGSLADSTEFLGFCDELLALVQQAASGSVTASKPTTESIRAVLWRLGEALPSVKARVADLAPRSDAQPASALAVDKKELARRKQAALLESMRRQQAAFASKHPDQQEDESPSLDEKDAVQLCVFCRQEAKPDTPLALIAHAQRSNIPWLAKRRVCVAFTSSLSQAPLKASHTYCGGWGC